MAEHSLPVLQAARAGFIHLRENLRESLVPGAITAAASAALQLSLWSRPDWAVLLILASAFVAVPFLAGQYRRALGLSGCALRLGGDEARLAGAIIGYVVVVLVVIGGFLALNGPVILDLMRWAQETDRAQPIRELPPQMGQLGFGYLLVLPMAWAAYAAMEAAVHRWLVRGEAGGGFLGLKIDAAFWHVWLCQLTWLPVVVGVAFLVALIVGAGIVGGNLAGGGLIGFLLGLVAALTGIAVGIYLPARFAPASALSVARGKYAFFDAWAATRGHALNLIGAFLILLVILYALSLAASFAVQGRLHDLVFGLTSGESLGQALGALGITTIAVVSAIYLGQMVFQLVMTLAMMGVNAKLARVATAAPQAHTPDAPTPDARAPDTPTQGQAPA